MKRFLIGLVAAGLILVPSVVQATVVVLPIDGYYQRQTLKQFGTFVDQAFLDRHPNEFRNNGFPKFTGYHAAVDVDYPGVDEQSTEVPVKAVAGGEVIYKGTVVGYGGVIVIRHTDPESVTTLYGHVRVADAPVQVGDQVTAGQTIAYLGAPYSDQTGGERKHLHFGIHQGTALGLEGHEQSTQALNANWYNPNDWLARHVPQSDPGLAAASPAPSPEPSGLPEPSKPQKSWLEVVIDFLAGLFR